jgi:hypothetical protein
MNESEDAGVSGTSQQGGKGRSDKSREAQNSQVQWLQDFKISDVAWSE